MATHTEGIVTVRQIVQNALWQVKRPQEDYKRFFQFATRAYRELRLHHTREGIKFAKLTPSTINTVNFPEDMVDFVAIGVPEGGKFCGLTRRDDIVITTTLVGLIETQDADKEEGVDIDEPSMDGFYGKGGINLDGYYKIDWENRRIFLNRVTKTEVILSYISSGVNVTGETYVPVKYENAIIAYIIWQDSMYDRLQLQNAQYYETQFRNAVALLDETPTYQEWLDALYATYSLLPQR